MKTAAPITELRTMIDKIKKDQICPWCGCSVYSEIYIIEPQEAVFRDNSLHISFLGNAWIECKRCHRRYNDVRGKYEYMVDPSVLNIDDAVEFITTDTKLRLLQFLENKIRSKQDG